jgi:Tol biopolymer transport system component
LSYELLQPDLWFESTSSVPSSMRQIERAPTTSAQPPAWGAPEPVTISTGNFTLLTGMGTPALVDASAITLLSSGLRGADTLFFDAVDKTIDGGTSPRHLWAGKVSFPGGNAVVSNAEEVSSLMNTELWSFTYSPAKKRAYATRGGSTPVLVEFATNGAAGTSITTVVGVRYSAPCPAAGDLAPWVRPDGEGLFFQSDNPCGGVARGTLFYQDLDGNGDGTGDAVPVLDGSFAGHTMEPSLSPDQCALVFHDTSDDRGVFYAAGRR